LHAYAAYQRELSARLLSLDHMNSHQFLFSFTQT
jgi:hypothetical protein